MTTKKLLAVWRYDQFPYLLTGEVDGFRNGNPYVPSYQCSFNTTCLLPLKPKGEQFRTKIDDLRLRHRQALEAVAKEFNAELQAIKKEFGVVI